MSGLENSASILPDYIDTQSLESEFALKEIAFTNAADALTPELAIQVAQGRTGSSGNVTTYKQTMQSVIDWLKYHNTAMKNAMDQSSNDSSDFSQVFLAKKMEVKELRKKVEDAREIDRIRQEQVKSLDLREEGNYHTSWMGLSRPLKDESRTGLIVAAGAFGVLALAGIFYIYKLRQELAPDSGFFRGGTRKGRYSS